MNGSNEAARWLIEGLHPIGKPGLHTRRRPQHELHPHQGVECIARGHLSLSRRVKNIHGGLERVGRMMVRAGKQKQIHSAGGTTHHACIHRPFRVLEGQHLRVVDRNNEELSARPSIHQERTLRVVDVLDDEETAMSMLEARGDPPRGLRGESLGGETGKPLRSKGIIPKGTDAVLEPRVFRAKCARSMLIRLPHPRSFGAKITGIAKRNHGLVREDDFGSRGILCLSSHG